MRQVTRDNHYVQRALLRRWADDGKKVWEYKMLVPRREYPEWKLRSIRTAGCQVDLYTTTVDGYAADHFELWFKNEVEDPAEEVLTRIDGGQPLRRRDVLPLVRYAVAQDLRTPKDFEAYRRWEAEYVPGLLNEVVRRAVENPQRSHAMVPARPEDEMPLVAFEWVPLPDGSHAGRATVTGGKESWLRARKRMIREYPERLIGHTWRILRAHASMEWPLSDHPVLRLGYWADRVSLDMAWAQRGAEIVMPLNPRCILYTRVGYNDLTPDHLPRYHTFLFRRFLLENAHRNVYMRTPSRHVRWFRPRTIDPRQYWRESRALEGK